MRAMQSYETFAVNGGADGCTGVPDNPFGFNFTEACNNHDNNYDAGIDRAIADRIFLNDMLDVCRNESSNWFSEMACEATAYVYYGGVRLFGGFFYPEASTEQ